MKILKNYSKLDNNLFTTIRNADSNYKYITGWYYEVETPAGDFTARLITKSIKKLKNTPTELLTLDTDTHTRADAIEELKKYFPDLNEESLILILICIKKSGGKNYFCP